MDIEETSGQTFWAVSIYKHLFALQMITHLEPLISDNDSTFKLFISFCKKTVCKHKIVVSYAYCRLHVVPIPGRPQGGHPVWSSMAGQWARPLWPCWYAQPH